MSDQLTRTDGYIGFPSITIASACGTWLAGIGLLRTAMRSCFLVGTSTWQCLLWPHAAPAYDPGRVDSSQVQFTLSGERFPIDLAGSYDVDKAKVILVKAPRTSRPTRVAFWRAYAGHMEWPDLDTGPDSTVNCSVPVIIATIDEARGRYMLVDGWHRIYKASAEGRDSIEGFYLTEEETKEVFDLTWKGLPGQIATAVQRLGEEH